jgi:arabinogalactan oligomer/maltooligosaccharide transport system permease protein
MNRFKRLQLVALVIMVAAVALGFRFRAVDLLPVDYDEDDYLAAAQHYARAILDRDLDAIVNYDYVFEHPPLAKLAFAVSILRLPEAPPIPELPATAGIASALSQSHLHVARRSAALLGALQALVLAWLNPLAGLLLAIHTFQIKYTSQVMIDALPSFTSLLAVLFYARSQRRWMPWLCLSALALGMTAASKYIYCVAGITIVVHWLWETRPRQSPLGLSRVGRWLLPVALWGVLSLVFFLLFDPWLWVDPVSRLQRTISFHRDFAQSEHVRRAGFPMWQPLVWLFGSVPWHPGVFPIRLDPYITLLAIAGVRSLWRRQRLFALWLLLSLGFLLIWSTKWPQYILTLTAPLSLAAAEGFRVAVWEPIRTWWARRRQGVPPQPEPETVRVARRDLRRAMPWLLPGAVALALLAAFPMVYQAAMSLTDFNSLSIRDGLQGGVWRAAWQGLTRRVRPVVVDLLASRSKTVNYVGFSRLIQLLAGGVPDVLVFNLLWTLLSVGLQAVLGVLAALLLHHPRVRFRRWWRLLFILPWAIPEFVGVLFWMRIFEPRFGWLVLARNVPWSAQPPIWFENPNFTLPSLLIAATWFGFPFIMLAATAGLRLIPDQVYDAAAVDGAVGWARFRLVTWPLLLPLLIPAIIVRAIFAFNQFYLFYVLGTDYPLFTFATLAYYVFNPTGPFGGQFATAAAINLFTVLVLVVWMAAFDRWSRASEGVTYA